MKFGVRSLKSGVVVFSFLAVIARKRTKFSDAAIQKANGNDILLSRLLRD